MIALGRIDRTDDRPLYHQIADILAEAVEDGRYSPGARLPAEDKLSSHFGVARMTVRHAIQELRRRGIVSTQQGRGVFVTQHLPAGSACGRADTNLGKSLLEARIDDWRRQARSAVHEAVLAHDSGDAHQASASAAMATMYFALALDAKQFGDQPRPPEYTGPATGAGRVPYSDGPLRN